MAIESIGRVSNESQSLPQQAVNTDDFLKLFLTQLNYQDPLEPVDNREFLTQLAEFSSLQIANSNSKSMESLLDVSSVNQSVSLLGKEVLVNSGNIPGGSAVGTVSAIELNGNNVTLGVSISADNVIRVSPSAVTVVRTTK
ncbi:flagellar hook capping protein [Cellvibrio sp. KY-GH-1]|uniref:flagellar hook capping FlgD N-terminal domain-containing protein n=1 Tax=Cellvibrio sp. KY-GH-1 TaxID=2303332 RepID=UPI0012463D2B|nr:flagellar hook capping FlgD N-terminal domain-containing protein [Cellvibrio sp. KY-GH-1]QEY18598.1 flagellar hook capping protein [Cellvibrio sp. KY-GH-1]